MLRGPRLTIWALVKGDRFPVREFSENEARPEDWEKLVRLIELAAYTWPAPLKNKRKCKHLRRYPGLHEFKDFRSGIRVMFFLDDDQNAVLTHCFVKDTDDTPPKQIQRALKMQHEWVDGGRLTDE